MAKDGLLKATGVAALGNESGVALSGTHKGNGMDKAAPLSTEETQHSRNARKLSMIVGDANGRPTARCIQRLSIMIPKQLKLGGEIPKDVLGFISLHKLSDLLTEKAEAKKAKTKGKGNDG